MQPLIDLRDNLQEMVVSRKYKEWVKKKIIPELEQSNHAADHGIRELLGEMLDVRRVDINMPVSLYELLRMINGWSPVIGSVLPHVPDPMNS